MLNVKATDICANCYREFADHNYVKGSLVQYLCPTLHCETTYGHFHGGDPRDFHPDYECCHKDEIDKWKAACAIWDEAESRGQIPSPEACESGWIYDNDGKVVAHVLRSSYGIGTMVVRTQTEWKPE